MPKRKAPRAFIIKFSTVNDLADVIFKTRTPLEKNPAVKGNKEFRLFAKSEFHACREMLEKGVRPEVIESIEQLNS